MNLFNLIAQVFKPLSDLVDSVHTSDAERMALNNQLASIQNNISMKMLELEAQKLKAQSEIITAEAQGQSFLQRNWRPITMLTFLLLVVLDSFGLLAFRLADEAWTLLQIGLGGYVVGRSVEKVYPNIIGKKQ